MESKKTCSERMRPILQAMERSIDSARSQRVGFPTVAGNPARVESPRPTLSNLTPVQNPINPQVADDPDTPRLKARPKPLNSPLVNPFERSAYRSQVG